MSYSPIATLARRSFHSVSSDRRGDSVPISPARTSAAAVVDKAQATIAATEHIFPSSMDAKTQRTYEVARQRMKKAADMVKIKAQKAAPPRSPRTGTPAGVGLQLHKDVDTLDGVLISGYKPHTVSTTDVWNAAYPPFEAKLVDLVTPKKPKKHNRGDSDFEVIPHVRSVIVLDDAMAPSVSPVDEPWEHVYADEDSDASESSGSDTNATVPRSYANVLSSTK